MKRKAIIFHLSIILLIIINSSCSTLKPIAEYDDCVKLDKNTLSQINGTYNRLSEDSVSTNANDLFSLFSNKGHNNDRNEDFVKFDIIDERHIEISLIKKDSIIFKKTLKGKLKNNTFEFNRRLKFYPIIVATIYMDSKVRIRLLESGELLIDAKTMEYGLVLFIIPIGGGEKKYNSVFKRKIN